ncbi:AAEL012926-PA [Aedes aegypti]|uniref:AAEL012926-PA n=1 Tax=Aedes aegypti TaxID=7159 RepID=Q16KP0_AEDAE|nr:AAEL012926-PA [Aedes aegypti]
MMPSRSVQPILSGTIYVDSPSPPPTPTKLSEEEQHEKDIQSLLDHERRSVQLPESPRRKRPKVKKESKKRREKAKAKRNKMIVSEVIDLTGDD